MNKNYYINTFTGREVYFIDPCGLNIIDLSLSLSRIPRYCGHTKKFYSVGQHCCLVSDLILEHTGDLDLALQGLLHEVSEAYGLNDIHGSLKRSLGKVAKRVIKEYEKKLYTTIGYPHGLNEYVDYIDSMILVDEMRQLFIKDVSKGVDFKDNKKYGKCKGFGIKITPWSMDKTNREFFTRYKSLTKELQERRKCQMSRISVL